MGEKDYTQDRCKAAVSDTSSNNTRTWRAGKQNMTYEKETFKISFSWSHLSESIAMPNKETYMVTIFSKKKGTTYFCSGFKIKSELLIFLFLSSLPAFLFFKWNFIGNKTICCCYVFLCLSGLKYLNCIGYKSVGSSTSSSF